MRSLCFLVVGLLPGCFVLPLWEDPVSRPPPVTPWQGPDGADAVTWTQVADTMQARNPSSFPPVNGEMLIGNATGTSLTVRVRGLKPSVHLDCAAVAKAPNVLLSRASFAPATTWLLDSGRAFGVGGTGQGCTALLVDGSGLPMRLLFWPSTAHQATTLPSTVQGAPAAQLLRLQVNEDGVVFAPRSEVLAPPPVLDPGPAPGCGQPDPAGDLAWSTPVPLGDQTLLQLESAPDGCMLLSLLSKQGVKPWALCLPPGAFPFAEGESFFIGALTGGHNLGTLEGFELLADKKKVRFGRGDDVVYFGAPTLALHPLPGCAGSHDPCGDLLAPLLAKVEPPGSAEVTLLPGQSLDVGSGGVLHVLQAASLAVADTVCLPGGQIGQRRVESVYIQNSAKP